MQEEPLVPSKNWPFRWVNGVDTAENRCINETKEVKRSVYDTIQDIEEGLF